MEKVSFYRCEKCKNIVMLVKDGGGTVSCCGETMTKLIANSTDAATEKHVPVAVVEDAKITVTVGSIDHPMVLAHYIEWIALVADNKTEIVYLKPGMKPEVVFTYNSRVNKTIVTGEDDEVVPNCEGQPCNFIYDENPQHKITVYAYCNLHGLWKAEY